MIERQNSKKNLLEKEISFGGAGLGQKAVFAKNLAVMLKSGIPITEALFIASDSASGKLMRVIKEIAKSVQSGIPLSEALERHPSVFSGFFVKVVRVGEVSGTLVESLENISLELEKEKALTAKIKGAMVYPGIVLFAAFLLGLAMAFWVLPQITPMFTGLKIQLPFTTRALIWFSYQVKERGAVLFFGISVLVFCCTWTLRQKFVRPVTHWLLLNIPVVKNLVYKSNLAQFCSTLGMLLKSGVSIDGALEVTRATVSNLYFQKALGRVADGVRKGARLSENLEQFDNLFPVLLIRMIAVGEESGRFEEVLFYLAKLYEDEVDSAAKNLTVAIEPLILIFIGLIVGFLFLAIITPIYSITGGINK